LRAGIDEVTLTATVHFELLLIVTLGMNTFIRSLILAIVNLSKSISHVSDMLSGDIYEVLDEAQKVIDCTQYSILFIL
jgi:hypothetical protein